MHPLYYLKNDKLIFIYSFFRIFLGVYLLFHAIVNVMNYDVFLTESKTYFEVGSPFIFLSYLTPIVPLLEFFLAGVIILGLYTIPAMKWALGLGIFFTLFFHFTGDLETALIHCYTVVIKLPLLIYVRYNKFSLDYYNEFQVKMETIRVRNNVS